eukprot:2831843-Pleurochrysis_carterae.AAC.1
MAHGWLHLLPKETGDSPLFVLCQMHGTCSATWQGLRISSALRAYVLHRLLHWIFMRFLGHN